MLGSGSVDPNCSVSLPTSVWLRTFSGTNGTPASGEPAWASAYAIASTSDCGSVSSTTTTGACPSARATRAGSPAASAASSADGRAAALCTTVGAFGAAIAAGLVAGLVAGFAAGALDAALGPKGWCLITTGTGADESPPRPSTMKPPPRATAATMPSSATMRTGGETESVTGRVSAPRTRDSSAEGAVSRALRPKACLRSLRAGARDDVGARACLLPRGRADGALDAVRQRVSRLNRQLGRDDGRVVVLQSRHGHARVAGRVPSAGVVGVVRLNGRDGGANVGLGSRLVGAILEREVRRDRDRQQDAENDDDNEELDERETLIGRKTLPDLRDHAGGSFHRDTNGVKPALHRRNHPPWVTLERVNGRHRTTARQHAFGAVKKGSPRADSSVEAYAAHLFNRRSARADGRAQRVRPARDHRHAAGHARAREHRAPRRLRAADGRGYAAAALPGPFERAPGAARDQAAARFLPLDSRPRAVSRQRVLPARVPRGGLPADPRRAEDARGAGPSRVAPSVGGEAARNRPRHRPDGIRQVDDARRADRRDQPEPVGAHPDGGGPDRVPAPPQAVHRQSA